MKSELHLLLYAWSKFRDLLCDCSGFQLHTQTTEILLEEELNIDEYIDLVLLAFDMIQPYNRSHKNRVAYK
jgi:hypothetical protein